MGPVSAGPSTPLFRPLGSFTLINRQAESHTPQSILTYVSHTYVTERCVPLH